MLLPEFQSLDWKTSVIGSQVAFTFVKSLKTAFAACIETDGF